MNLTETVPDPVATRRQLRDLTALLIGEFDGLTAGTVMLCVARCRHTCLRSGSRRELVARVESLARARLESRTATNVSLA